MTTGDCCHLPGSLCDCPGSAALSKSVEDSDIGRPQYITQVTAKDGRLLSTVIKALGAQRLPGPFLPLCPQPGAPHGVVVLNLIPLESSQLSFSLWELCPSRALGGACREQDRASQCCSALLIPLLPPSLQWLKDPGPRNEKRTLFCDMVCFLFITPLAAISGWLCLRGAQDHLQFNSRLEAIGLIALTIALFTIYVLWTLVSFRYHCQLYSEWRRTNQKVRLMLPTSRSPHPLPHSLLSAKLMKKTA
ncbi:E3 ubiquitin-protein ligase MARCH2, partial [Calypte anna]